MRDQRLDSLRGILLAILTIDHFDGWLRSLTWQTFGFVSAAEGFIFLAGYLFAQVNAKYVLTPVLLRQRANTRAAQIYLFHLLVAIGLPLLSLLLPFYAAYWHEWLAPYYQQPTVTLAASLVFLQQASSMSVLPIYVMLVLFSPWLLRCFAAGKALHVLSFSAVLWLLGQFVNPLNLLIELSGQPFREGHFNWFAWQLVYVVGMWLGYRVYSGQALRLPQGRYLWACAVIALGFMALRHLARWSLMPEWLQALNDVEHGFASNVHHLGWVRVVNAGFLIVVLAWLMARWQKTASLPFFAFLGAHSLQVFSFHIALLYFMLPVGFRFEEHWGHVGYTLYMFMIVACLAIPAYLHAHYRASRR